MPQFQFDSLGDFLSMGGDAAFVWGAYAFFALSIVWHMIQPGIERRRVVRLLKARLQREQGNKSN